MYVKDRSIEDACWIFDGWIKQDFIAFDVMFEEYTKSGDGNKAFQIFHLMQQKGKKLNRISYLSILDAYLGPKGLAW